MIDDMLPPVIFQKQREFIRIFGAKRDFVWWAKTLVTEETKELIEADEKNLGMNEILKEMADLVYVLAGFYNTMPQVPDEIIDEKTNQEIQKIYQEAVQTLSDISQKLKITAEIVTDAFMIVHESNLSKLDDDGNPIRREDGKILKGPNYKAPDMTPVVQKWESFVRELRRTGQDKSARKIFEEMVSNTTRPN